MKYPFWRNIDASPDKEGLTLKVLQDAYEHLTLQPPQEELHLLRANRQYCDLCGPRSLIGEETWRVLHGAE